VSNWPATLDLFKNEYHVPLLPPAAAAVTGAFGELFFSALLVVGIGGRAGPLGLFAVNLMAIIFLSTGASWQRGTRQALAQHILWGFMLVMLAVYGLGALAVDNLLVNRFGQKQRW